MYDYGWKEKTGLKIILVITRAATLSINSLKFAGIMLVLPFVAAAFLKSDSVSSIFPFRSSHLGLSGRSHQVTRRNTFGIQNTNCNWRQSRMKYATPGSTIYPKANGRQNKVPAAPLHSGPRTSIAKKSAWKDDSELVNKPNLVS